MDDYSLSQQTADYQRVEQALRFLEEHFRQQPDLAAVAASVNLSPYHFQRLFKRWVGISPTQFMHYLTIEYAKQWLDESRSVLETAYAAGLSGPSRLHDLFITWEAMTPGEYKQQAAGLVIRYGVHDSPFGRCLLATTPRGICALFFDAPDMLDDLHVRWPQATLIEDSARTAPLVEQIFAAPSPDRPFNLVLKGTNFQVNVWRALLSIPPGAVVSYEDLAAYVGRPDATRAVAGAVARNPISYLVPCHRVIRKSGNTNKYRWGATRKRALLGWEAAHYAPAAGQDE